MLLLAALTQGCATKSPDSMPVQPLRIPKPAPTLMKPVSPESYLERAQRNTQSWHSTLIGSETK